MLKHGILGLINYHSMSGYEIMEVFRDSLHFFWNASTSQIYRELITLENKNWITKTVVIQVGKPDKNIFAITEEGRAELIKWLANGDLGLTPRTPILMKVFFMGELSKDENIMSFERLRSYCIAFNEGLDKAYDYIEVYSGVLDKREKALYWKMAVDYGKKNMEMYISWANSCIAMLKEKNNEYITD